ncbi:hypothetical protein M0R04_15725 [Candidatus Dojkabacteria bacterium]|jgi:hypothetical protein|nr:hypothetical protein [Candidatus Dojkabacteria bacterium]
MKTPTKEEEIIENMLFIKDKWIKEGSKQTLKGYVKIEDVLKIIDNFPFVKFVKDYLYSGLESKGNWDLRKELKAQIEKELGEIEK